MSRQALKVWFGDNAEIVIKMNDEEINLPAGGILLEGELTELAEDLEEREQLARERW